MTLLDNLGLVPEGEQSTPEVQPPAEPAAPVAPAEPATEPEEEIVVPEGAENPDAVKNAIAAERAAARAAYKRAKEAEAKLAEIMEAGKPVEERLTDAQKVAAEAKLEAARLRVGMKHGLSLTFSELLKGSDEETLEQHAQAIIAELGTKPRTQLPGLDGGVKPDPPAPVNPEQGHNNFLAQIITRHKTGA